VSCVVHHPENNAKLDVAFNVLRQSHTVTAKNPLVVCCCVLLQLDICG
jgi:hypothetical protein